MNKPKNETRNCNKILISWNIVNKLQKFSLNGVLCKHYETGFGKLMINDIVKEL